MKHYPHHIGDFDRATRHLTRIERSVYRDLIDLYYDTEAPLTLDMAALCRRIIARTNEESTAVEQALNEFFTKTPTGWYHERCEEEIAAYRANNSQRAQAGKASAEAKRLKKLQALNGNSTIVDDPLKPVATNGNGEPTNQSTNQPINQFPPPPVRAADSIEVFVMHEGWAPSPAFIALAKMAGLPVNTPDFPGPALGEFVAYWVTRPSASRTQSEWDHALIKSMQADKARAPPGRQVAPRKGYAHTGFDTKDYTAGVNPDGTLA